MNSFIRGIRIFLFWTTLMLPLIIGALVLHLLAKLLDSLNGYFTWVSGGQ